VSRDADGRDRDYLEQILEAIARIERYVAVGEERFYAETHWQDAVIRQLEINGEATKRISTALKDRHPEVEWRRMTGMRDVLAHEYPDIDLGIVWGVTQQVLPGLKHQTEGILADVREE
jgi:uncharacterized protein with HEPN domain